MSRSTFKFEQYSLTGGTSVVEIVSGFLLRSLSKELKKQNSMLSRVIERLQYYMSTYRGFIWINLDGLHNGELEYFKDVVLKCISEIRSMGQDIPLEEVKNVQLSGFLPQDVNYIVSLDNKYILDYLNQLLKMLSISSDDDLEKANQSTSYQIEKDDN